MSFVELRAHTAFSFGDGAVTPEALLARAAELGYGAIGITDTADLGAIARAAIEAGKQGIKLIVGAELRVDGRPMALLARDSVGCRNLASLITRSRVGALSDWPAASVRQRQSGQPPRGMPRGMPDVPWSCVAERAEGLHLLTGPASGTIAALVRKGRHDDAMRTLHRWREAFGGRIAVEVHSHACGGDESALAGALVNLAEQADVAWVATNNPRYLNNSSRLVHEILTALRAGTDLDGAAERGLLHPNGGWRLISPVEMAQIWEGREEGIRESERIAGECDFSVRWLRPPLPDFPGKFPGDANDILRASVYEGASERWGSDLSDRQRGQIEHELGVIRRLGFAGFFLVMWDAVRFARQRNILCQGRGSAANSAVAYCLQVTAVDPVRHGLLFERFLSGARVPGASGEYTEAPDIDVDIEHSRREEVLDYVYGSYRREHSAITCVVQTYGAPNAILEAMRALGYPPELSLSLSKRLHRYDPAEGADIVRDTLAKRLGLDLMKNRGRALLTAMRAFDGIPRMRSTHVGGFVLSAAPLGDYLPIEHTNMGRTIIQFDKDDLDIIGVPKFDFLGLGALSHIRHAFDAIEHRTGTRPAMYGLPEDGETFAMIASGDTVGTFQIESRAQIASIVNTRPDGLYDIAVQIALVRPGPIQGNFVRPYTRRRRGQEGVSYAHPLLQPILERTCGIPIFQEQAMAISSTLGGFTAEEADGLRRTMGNIRKKGRLEKVLEELTRRMVENDELEPRLSQEKAEQISSDLLTFANYGFPESHAWSFALIAYATAYLKCRYPAYFYLGLLNAQPMGFYPASTLIHDARRHGVEVLPPCLFRGERLCTTEDGPNGSEGPAMRIGWRHIRGVGQQTIERLCAARSMVPFGSIADVVERVGLKRAEALQFARAAAFAAWEPDRRRAAWEALRVIGDRFPFAPARRTSYDPRPLDERELIFMDYHATGICITGHPMQHLRDRLRGAGVTASEGLERLRDGARVVVAGLVTVRQRPATAKGTVFLLLEDEWGFINVVVPKKIAEQYTDIIKFAQFVILEGKFERDGAGINVVGRRFKELNGGSLAHDAHSFH
ncbi:MAG: DNA polymerase III subunit alpha [Gemmatimonadaceae bacterium]